MYNSVLGMSLSDVIDHLWENGMVIDWGEFLIESRKHGMSLENIRRLVSGGFSDSTNCRDGVQAVEEFFQKITGGREE